MKIWIRGKEYEIPIREDGSVDVDAIKAAGAIPADRVLIRQGMDGANEVANPGDTILAHPEDHFTDMPLSVRGA